VDGAALAAGYQPEVVFPASVIPKPEKRVDWRQVADIVSLGA